jgi:hypothetical protein
MNYRHYLTFRYERRTNGANGWVWVDTTSADVMMSVEGMEAAIATVRETGARSMWCAPEEVLVFLVNHTVVTL